MAEFNRYPSHSYAPSAPPMPDSYSSSQSPAAEQPQQHHQPPPPAPSYAHSYSSSSYPSYSQGYSSSSSSSYPSYSPSYASSYSCGGGGGGGGYFPPGTHPEIIRSFEAVDRDRSGFIDEKELQEALSSGYHKFSIRTIRLLMFLFKNPSHPTKIGRADFAALWNCVGQWRSIGFATHHPEVVADGVDSGRCIARGDCRSLARGGAILLLGQCFCMPRHSQTIFDRFDRDRSGKIDSEELREALQSLGYAVPPSVIQVLISNYTDGRSGRGALNFDNFVECGMIVKGLTEKFKEKDTRYSGSATFTYDAFMSMVIPFIVP